MAAKAARNGLARADLPAEQVDLVISASHFAEHLSPGISAGVMRELGIQADFLNIDNGCCSWLSALEIAQAYLTTGAARAVLVLNVTNFVSRAHTFRLTPASAVLGEGATATVVQPGGAPVRFSTVANPDRWAGLRFEQVCSAAGGPEGDYLSGVVVNLPDEVVADITHTAQHDVPRCAREAVELAGLSLDDVDCLITHQPNRAFLKLWRRQLSRPGMATIDTFLQHGNTFSVTLPASARAAIDADLPRHHVLFTTFTHSGELIKSAVLDLGATK